MIAYAAAVVLDHKSIPGRRTWTNMKELVATSGDVWESSIELHSNYTAQGHSNKPGFFNALLDHRRPG